MNIALVMEYLAAGSILVVSLGMAFENRVIGVVGAALFVASFLVWRAYR